MMTPKRENELMLAKLLGISEGEAGERLAVPVSIRHGEGEAAQFAQEISDIVGRTLSIVPPGNGAVDMIVGCDNPSNGDAVVVSLSRECLKLSDTGSSVLEECHPLSRCIAACYASAALVSKALGIHESADGDRHFYFGALGVTEEMLNAPIHIEDAVLAGAGAIGNGFLKALEHLDVYGTLYIADPKVVSAGNLNRCPFFEEGSIDEPKAIALAEKAQRFLKNLRLEPFPGELHDFIVRRDPKRISRVFVATDSPRSRRHIQFELPLEVIDASTTAADEIIVHSHRFPTSGACLACIYAATAREAGREKDIADGLGVSVDDVAKARIDAEAAATIAALHSTLDPATLIGRAYDSLFKALCAEQALALRGGEQVLAPFSFVSELAGALMAVELVRFGNIASEARSNYLFTTAWAPPHARTRLTRPKLNSCEFCSNKMFLAAMRELWKDVIGAETAA